MWPGWQASARWWEVFTSNLARRLPSWLVVVACCCGHCWRPGE
nr:MAG TPA_asm: hypothetical protein [Caudoviricetes sp.]